MIWILILMTYKGGVAMQEFNTEAACNMARAYIQAEHARELRGSGSLIAICAQKGTK